jgi:hypothetical protein
MLAPKNRFQSNVLCNISDTKLGVLGEEDAQKLGRVVFHSFCVGEVVATTNYDKSVNPIHDTVGATLLPF